MVTGLALAGCGGPAVSSCELAGSASSWTCLEWEGEPYGSTKSQCAAFGAAGRWSEQRCPREKAVGGCRMHIGDRTFTEWFGGSTTEERIREDCQFNPPPGVVPGVRVEYVRGGAAPSPAAGDAGALRDGR
jgi:hypothetical protein